MVEVVYFQVQPYFFRMEGHTIPTQGLQKATEHSHQEGKSESWYLVPKNFGDSQAKRLQSLLCATSISSLVANLQKTRQEVLGNDQKSFDGKPRSQVRRKGLFQMDWWVDAWCVLKGSDYFIAFQIRMA